jgi:hypothetical protein
VYKVRLRRSINQTMQYSNAFRVVAITHMRQYHDGDRNVGDEPLRLPVLEVGLLGARPDGCCGERGASTCAFKEKKCTRSMSRREAFPCRPSSGGAPASPRCRCRRWACSYMKGDEAGACGRFTGNPPRTDPDFPGKSRKLPNPSRAALHQSSN